MKKVATNLSHGNSLGRNCTKCQRVKEILFFYSKGRYSDGSVRYESICKMCKKKKEKSRYKSKKRRREFQREFTIKVLAPEMVDKFQSEKTLNFLRSLVLEALGK